jgi:iron complex outermembrane receptor protein
LRSVEVLRDGASALYGSDAIAGVMNFNLRTESEGGEIRMQHGVYADTAGGPGGLGIGRRGSLEGQGGEKDYKVQLNFGMPLTEDGFINVSSELYSAQGTSRVVDTNLLFLALKSGIVLQKLRLWTAQCLTMMVLLAQLKYSVRALMH